MLKDKEELLFKAMERTIEDNARIAEQTKRKAAQTGDPIIDPTVSKRFLNAIRAASGKSPQ
jgi:hypothetical protein